MSSSFENTLRAVGQHRLGAAWLVPGLGLLAAWGTWMWLAELAVYTTTTRARIEVKRMPSHIAPDTSGRVSQLNLELDRRVELGDELLTLESSVQNAQLERQLAELGILDKKRAGIEAQIAAERGLRESRARLAGVTAVRADVGLRKAEVAAAHQELLSNIVDQLRREQLNSEVDAVNASGELLRSRLAVVDAETEIAQLAATRDYDDKTERTRMAELERQLVEIEAERVRVESAVVTARAELARRRVLAPASGYVGQLAPVQLGDIIQAGQVIGTIVPADGVRVVAYFPPQRAVGLVFPGQPARVRLDGYSWVEFGALDAVVARTASEPLEGLVRIELVLTGPPQLDLPLRHGQTAAVDICTQVASPWALVLRSVGGQLGNSPSGSEGHAFEQGQDE